MVNFQEVQQEYTETSGQEGLVLYNKNNQILARIPRGGAKNPSISGGLLPAQMATLNFSITATANTTLCFGANTQLIQAAIASIYGATPTRFYIPDTAITFAAPFPAHISGNADFALPFFQKYLGFNSYLYTYAFKLGLIKIQTNLANFIGKTMTVAQVDTNGTVTAPTEAVTQYKNPNELVANLVNIVPQFDFAMDLCFFITILAAETLDFTLFYPKVQYVG